MLPSSEFADRFEFHHMSERPLYQACPNWLIDRCELRPTSSVVDLGCGSGLVTRELLRRFPVAPQLRIFAIDPSEFELGIARSLIHDPRVEFLQAHAQEAVDRISDADAVIFCNVMHQIPRSDRAGLIGSVLLLLRHGGTFSFNTLFYDGAVLAETKPFYLAWMKEARAYLRALGIAMQIPREIGVARQTLTAEEQHEMVAAAGFRVVEREEVRFDWALEDWEALSRYSVFIRGALGPVGLETGSAALIHGVRRAYEKLGLTTVPRRWFHLAAKR